MNFEIFCYENNKEIRTFEIDGQPYFVGKDVATILGYVDTNQAIRKHVDFEDRMTRRIDGGKYVSLINESGLYSLILSSKLPSAKAFKRWVTSEVLPAIRKNGKYIALVKMQPMINFCEAYDTTDNDIIIREMAHRITQAGYPIGEKRLFEWLRNNKYLCKGKASYNQPTQKALELGLFRERYIIMGMSSGSWCNRTTKITPKGQKYFLEKFMKQLIYFN